MTSRVACCIPGCVRTTAKPYREWICAAHWRLLSAEERRVWTRHKRQARKFDGPSRPEAYNRIWDALKGRAAARQSTAWTVDDPHAVVADLYRMTR